MRRLAELQRALLLSHSAGTGPDLDDAIVRLVLVLKACSWLVGTRACAGRSSRRSVALANATCVPRVPMQVLGRRVGRPGTPRAPSGVLIGEGEARVDGRAVPASEALARAGLAPIALAPKEGLALINGTQVSTALALAGLFIARARDGGSVRRGTMSVDACRAATRRSTRASRRCAGTRAARRRDDLPAAARGSAIPRVARRLSARAGSVQPALPAAGDGRGARPDTLGRRDAVTEANAVSDNPLVFATTDEVLSGGNFHAEPVAFAATTCPLAIAETGAIAERRIALLMDCEPVGPAAVSRRGWRRQLGFMIAQVTGRRARLREQVARAPAQRRLATDLGEPGRPREHGDRRGRAARADGRATSRRSSRSSCSPPAQGIDLRRPLATSAPLGASTRLRAVAAFGRATAR
jgi:histidine ammonia-lyase